MSPMTQKTGLRNSPTSSQSQSLLEQKAASISPQLQPHTAETKPQACAKRDQTLPFHIQARLAQQRWPQAWQAENIVPQGPGLQLSRWAEGRCWETQARTLEAPAPGWSHFHKAEVLFQEKQGIVFRPSSKSVAQRFYLWQRQAIHTSY